MIYFLFLSYIACFLCTESLPSWQYHDFDKAMQLTQFPASIARTQHITGIDGSALLHQFRTLYTYYNPSACTEPRHPIIPKIIHQIWLGGPVPEAFKPLMNAWKNLYEARGWEYRLWTDSDIENFGLYNKQYYDQSTNYGVKSDILKWEIIYRLGGFYVDVDFEPLAPLDDFLYLNFLVGIQPLDTQFLQLGAALFAAPPGNPILKHCIETIKDDWHCHGAPTKTGPVHFTKSFFIMAGKNGSKDLALPSLYFYPLGCLEHECSYEKWLSQGSYAIHHWAKSWMPKQYRPHRFRSIDNDSSSKTWNE